MGTPISLARAAGAAAEAGTGLALAAGGEPSSLPGASSAVRDGALAVEVRGRATLGPRHLQAYRTGRYIRRHGGRGLSWSGFVGLCISRVMAKTFGGVFFSTGHMAPEGPQRHCGVKKKQGWVHVINKTDNSHQHVHP